MGKLKKMNENKPCPTPLHPVEGFKCGICKKFYHISESNVGSNNEDLVINNTGHICLDCSSSIW